MLIRGSYGLLRCSNRTKEVNQDAATIVSCMKISRKEIFLRRTKRRGINMETVKTVAGHIVIVLVNKNKEV